MKMSEAITRADNLRDNTLDEQQKADWLFSLDCKVAEIMGIPHPEEAPAQAPEPSPAPPIPADGIPLIPLEPAQPNPYFNNWPEDRELMMPPPHDDIYVYYLVAMYDYYNQESSLYANDMAIFNSAFADARAWWRRNHKPKAKGALRVM